MNSIKHDLYDDNGKNLFEDMPVNNLMKDIQEKLINDISIKREAIIKSKTKELLGFEIDLKEEAKRRFKRFAIEYNRNEETIYFNDGSMNGKRIVTFVRKENPIDFNRDKYSMSIEYSYY